MNHTGRALNFDDVPLETQRTFTSDKPELPYVYCLQGVQVVDNPQTPPDAPVQPGVVFLPDEEDALFTPPRRQVLTCPPAPARVKHHPVTVL